MRDVRAPLASQPRLAGPKRLRTLGAAAMAVGLTLPLFASSGAGPSPQSAGALAQKSSAVVSASHDRLQAFCHELLEIAQLPSFSYAIAEHGALAAAGACGVVNVESEDPATSDTSYRMASVSKLATATAAARLAEQGIFDLDRPISEWLPEFPAAEQITARQLLGHLSGVAHYQPVDKIEPDRSYTTAREALSVFRDSPRAGAPGERYAYTTHGFTLLSAAMEAAAAKTFLEILSEEVFKPLGMSSSGPDLRDAVPGEMATLYRWVARKNYRIPKPENPSYKWGGGGLISTPSDLVRLGAAYLDGAFLEPDTVAEMFASQRTSDGKETGVGLAWRSGKDAMGRAIVHHAGSMGGARSLLLLYPDEKLALAMQTNTAWPSAIELTGQAMAEAWRHRERPGSENPARERSGSGGQETLRFRGQFGREGEGVVVAGEIELDGNDGHMTTPTPIREWLERSSVDSLKVKRLTPDIWLVFTPLTATPLYLEGSRARTDLGGRRLLELDIVREDG